MADAVQKSMPDTIGRVPAYAYAILAAGWLTWVAPFFLIKRGDGVPQKLDRRARWGINPPGHCLFHPVAEQLLDTVPAHLAARARHRLPGALQCALVDERPHARAPVAI